MKFAVIETGGKQYLVKPQDKFRIEKLEGDAGAKIVFDKVLLTADGEKVAIGQPYVAGGTVEASVVSQGRADKVIVFKYHNKTRYRRKRGHRQHYTEVEITKI